MESFTFNGISSDSLGIIVKQMPPVSKAEKNIESIEINGRNGRLHIDNKTYKTKNYTIACILLDNTKVDQIKALFEGTGILTLSTEPNRQYQATIKNQIDFSKYLTYLREFPLQFELDPIAFSISENVIEFSSDSTFNVNGTVSVKPTLIIEGIGTVTLNNTKITVSETDITIDCDLMECVNNNINKSDKVILDKFPELVIGANSIVLGEGITKVTISYKEGWL